MPFLLLKGQTLGKAFIQWVHTEAEDPLAGTESRNFWPWDWAGGPDRSHPRNAKSAHHRLSFLGELAKLDRTVEKSILFPTSLQNFAQLQMFRSETAASKHLWSNVKSLTPTIPRPSLLGADNRNRGRAKPEWSPRDHDINFPASLHSSLSSDLRSPRLFSFWYTISTF